MRFYLRMLVFLAAALLPSALLFNFANSWFGDETSVLRLGFSIVFELRRAEAMKARADSVGRSLDIKRDIISQLVARRLELREAIDRFHKANQMIGQTDSRLMATYRLPADLEGVGRQVLTWAYQEVEPYPSEKTQRLLADLESEYQRLFGRPSALDLGLTEPALPNGRASI